MTESQIIAEIKNKLKTYDNQGLLDMISIKAGIRENLREFGGNIMTQHQVSVRVKNGRAKLPDNFYALKAAVKCEQEGYHEVKAKTKKHAQRRIAYFEWTEIKDYYNYLDGKPCTEDSDSKYITETLYIETEDKAYDVYYKQPAQLRLIPHTYKVRCESNCPNLINDSEYEISIDENHNYISTNFNDGFIWLWYKGLPTSDSGELLIPDTARDKLKNYIIYFAIVRTLQALLLSEDDVNVFNKLQIFQPLMEEYYYAAKSDSVSEGLRGWREKVINNNRREIYKYENMIGSLTPNRR